MMVDIDWFSHVPPFHFRFEMFDIRWCHMFGDRFPKHGIINKKIESIHLQNKFLFSDHVQDATQRRINLR
jgi:hypothetical protein